MSKKGPEQAARGNSNRFLLASAEGQPSGKRSNAPQPRSLHNLQESSVELHLWHPSVALNSSRRTRWAHSPHSIPHRRTPQEGPLQHSRPQSHRAWGQAVELSWPGMGLQALPGKLREGIRRGLGKWALASQTNSPAKGVFLELQGSLRSLGHLP